MPPLFVCWLGKACLIISWVAIQRCYNLVFAFSFLLSKFLRVFLFVRINGYTNLITWVQDGVLSCGVVPSFPRWQNTHIGNKIGAPGNKNFWVFFFLPNDEIIKSTLPSYQGSGWCWRPPSSLCFNNSISILATGKE